MIKHVRDTTVRSLHYHNALRISWCDSKNCERFPGLGGRQQVNHETHDLQRHGELMIRRLG